jgi:hypothetical protein
MSQASEFGSYSLDSIIRIEETVTVADLGFTKEEWEKLSEDDRIDNLRGYFLELVHDTVDEMPLRQFAKGKDLWEDLDKDEDDDEEEEEEEEDDEQTPLAMLEMLVDQGSEFPEALWRVCRRFPYVNSSELAEDYDQISQIGVA